MSYPADAPFDLDEFLAEPLTVRVATSGPTVRPMWYLWAEGAFWLMSGPWAMLFTRVQRDPRIALVVDVCELETGRIRVVNARGAVEIAPYDIPRGRRLLERYLGPDEQAWPELYRGYVQEPLNEGLSWLKLDPQRWTVQDFSR